MYIRTLSPAEQTRIEAGLRSSDAFTLRRSQIRLSSSREQRPKEIARNRGCATQTVRNTIHAFEQKGLACLKQFLSATHNDPDQEMVIIETFRQADPPAWDQRASRQALDHQSRSRLCQEKNGATPSLR